MKLSRAVVAHRMLELLLHTLWPVTCPVCGRLGSILCDECRDSLMSEPPLLRCLYCENLSPCPKHPNAPTIHAAAAYDGQIRSAILNLKKNYRALGPKLGEGAALLFNTPIDHVDFDALVPVPLHIGSPRKYNQSFEIARGMARVWRVPVIEAARWSSVIKNRIGMSAAERKQLTPGAFTVSQEICGMRVALVDDVCTTGTTLSCLARACEQVGASVVAAYTLARAILT